VHLVGFIIRTIENVASTCMGSRSRKVISIFIVTPCMLSSHSIIIPTNALI